MNSNHNESVRNTNEGDKALSNVVAMCAMFDQLVEDDTSARAAILSLETKISEQRKSLSAQKEAARAVEDRHRADLVFLKQSYEREFQALRDEHARSLKAVEAATKSIVENLQIESAKREAALVDEISLLTTKLGKMEVHVGALHDRFGM